jgi:hypothetical protein
MRLVAEVPVDGAARHARAAATSASVECATPRSRNTPAAASSSFCARGRGFGFRASCHRYCGAGMAEFDPKLLTTAPVTTGCKHSRMYVIWPALSSQPLALQRRISFPAPRSPSCPPSPFRAPSVLPPRAPRVGHRSPPCVAAASRRAAGNRSREAFTAFPRAVTTMVMQPRTLPRPTNTSGRRRLEGSRGAGAGDRHSREALFTEGGG